MKRVILVLLALMVLGCGLCGCETEADKIAEIAGRWESTSYFSSDSVLSMLQEVEFYDEEIALLDPGSVVSVDVIEFNEDKTYTITCDAQETISMVEQFFRDAFDTFYANRTLLDECYEEDLTSMTEEEFKAFYAMMYAQTDFDALIEALVYNAVDEEFLLQDTETGTYRIMNGKIYCTIDGSSTEEYIEYSVTGDTLTLVFTDATRVYTR